MASDEIVWQIINQQFCAYKLSVTKSQTFCRNEHNVTGLCNRQSCPLANSRYATVRSIPETGRLYLYIKTIERSHMPNRLWERIKLSQNYQDALAQIEQRLPFFPKYLIHKCKQRLTRLTQVAIRTRRLARDEERLGEKLVPKLAPKVKRREETRERKAEAAAKVERAVERELIQRLKSGAYGDRPLNVDETLWKKILKNMERQGEGLRDEDLDEGIEEEEEEEEAEVEYVSDDLEEESDMEDLEDWLADDGAAEEASELSGSDDEDDGESGTDESSLETDFTTKPASGAKRKRQPTLRKPAKRVSKKPKVQIEYEAEPVRELLHA